MASVAGEGAHSPRTLQDLATAELLQVLLSVVPTGIAAGLRDFTTKKEPAPSTGGNGLKRVQREANCSELNQPAPRRLSTLSTLLWWSCPVLVLVNIPILAFVTFVVGPAVVFIATSCMIPVALAGLATCLLREKDKGRKVGQPGNGVGPGDER